MNRRHMHEAKPTIDWKAELTTALLNVPDVEQRDDGISIPLDFHVALEVEHEDGYLHVWVRGWDVTGGLAAETEIGHVRQVRHAAALVRSVIREHAQDVLAEEVAMRGVPER